MSRSQSLPVLVVSRRLSSQGSRYGVAVAPTLPTIRPLGILDKPEGGLHYATHGATAEFPHIVPAHTSQAWSWTHGMPHRTELTVRWGDTDAGGLIYYPQFFSYVVVGLNDYFAPAVDAGHLMENLRQDGYALPAVEGSASFVSPLRAGDCVVVETAVDAGVSSLTVPFQIGATADGDIAAEGEVAFVLVNEAFDPVPLPTAIRDCIREREDDDSK